MNANFFDLALASALGDSVSGVGVDGKYYTALDRLQASLRAAREYSRYNALRRRVCTAITVTSMAIGDTTVTVVGGGVFVGDTFVIGASEYVNEKLVVQSVVPSSVENATNTIDVTFTTAAQMSHNIGTIIEKTPKGMRIVTSMDMYALPLDFIRVDQESFDLAVGVKNTHKASLSIYDDARMFAKQLTNFGFGGSSNYGITSPLGYALIGDPYDNPTGAPGSQSSLDVTYTFYESDIPIMGIAPPPSGETTLEFDYYGSHTLSTIPSKDFDAVLSYALYASIEATIKAINNQVGVDRKIQSAEYATSKSIAQLRMDANNAKQDFYDRIRYIPYMTSG